MTTSVPPEPVEPEQHALLPEMARTAVRRAKDEQAASSQKKRKEVAPAEVDPVAQVLVDVPLAHLDRPFDYLVPSAMARTAVPGVRVKVRFAGQDVDGYVVGRVPASDYPTLQPLRRVVSAEPVLHADVAELSALVAQRYAGTRSDVLRLAVPPRHATTEKEEPLPPAVSTGPAEAVVAAAREAWSSYEHGGAFVDHLARGGAVRSVWGAAPGADWPGLLAHAAATTYAAGRGVLLCVPDGRDLDRLDAALTARLGEGHHVALRADAGPAARYREFLAVSRGARRVVVGTRAAAWAPVADLGLVVVWDDGDDLHAEPRAPYPHTREVLVMRAEQHGAAAIVGGFARSVESVQLVASGWARPVSPPRAWLRDQVRVSVTGATERELERDPHARSTRVPTLARDLVRTALATGPVLVQTPRAGYAVGLACERCRTPARCTTCTGPLQIPGATAPPTCRWCGTADRAWACTTCGHHGLRAPVLGDARTAEELGRMFPSVPVRTSAGDAVVASVPDKPALVVATPGAEPYAEGPGYAGVLLLDTWLALARVDLHTGEEAVRRWLNAAALVRPGGAVVAVGDPAEPTLQALVRWDPTGYAEREAAERAAARLPPASRLATVTGEADAVELALAHLHVEGPVEVLGPVPVAPRAGVPAPEEPEVRAVVRVPATGGDGLSAALGALQRERSARKLPAVRVQLDPPSL
ncbi:primosomal protein N' [Nocardioides alkalitolerans]|uniref:primosomal protein N' n=1 Tax=Nocardioides alkalitolerans TaxID=281714 RepID=UPI0004278826|nr:primosomal protein N' [Nocardioides alkalitolerans]